MKTKAEKAAGWAPVELRIVFESADELLAFAKIVRNPKAIVRVLQDERAMKPSHAALLGSRLEQICAALAPHYNEAEVQC